MSNNRPALFFALTALLWLNTPPALANEAYPKKVRIAFLDSCVKLNKELVEPCKCIINNLEKHLSYEKFQTVIQQADPMQDRTVKAISQPCAFKANGRK